MNSVNYDEVLIRWLSLRCLAGAALKFTHGKELPSVDIRAVSGGNRREYGAVLTKTEFEYLFRVQPLTQELTMSFAWTCAAQRGRICCVSGQKFAHVAAKARATYKWIWFPAHPCFSGGTLR